jgi:hypothetical protein
MIGRSSSFAACWKSSQTSPWHNILGLTYLKMGRVDEAIRAQR